MKNIDISVYNYITCLYIKTKNIYIFTYIGVLKINYISKSKTIKIGTSLPMSNFEAFYTIK